MLSKQLIAEIVSVSEPFYPPVFHTDQGAREKDGR